MTQRIVWADETQQRLRDVSDQINELERRKRDIKAQCNHTYSVGKSALRTVTDNDEYGPAGLTVTTVCTVCATTL